MRGNKGLWVVLAAACVATLLAAVVVPVAPHVDDMRRLLSGARSLVEGKPPGDLLAAYPPSSAVQYLPLALLPSGLTEVLLRVASAAILVWVVVTFGRDDSGRLHPWSLVLLISPPAIELVRIDQFNTALALLTLVVAYRLIHSEKRFLAGLVAGVSMSRPLGAVPVIAGLFRGEGRRHALGFGLGVLIFVGMTLGVAFVWDHNLVHDILVAGVRRPLVGLVGVMRFEFGLVGVLVLLTMVGVLCNMIAAARRDRPRDAFVVILAISCIGVHFGGPYVAVFALPGLARLTAVASPWWAVGTTFVYAALLDVASLTTEFGSGQGISLAVIFAPLMVAVLPLWLLYRPLGATERTLTPELTLPAAAEAA